MTPIVIAMAEHPFRSEGGAGCRPDRAPSLGTSRRRPGAVVWKLRRRAADATAGCRGVALDDRGRAHPGAPLGTKALTGSQVDVDEQVREVERRVAVRR